MRLLFDGQPQFYRYFSTKRNILKKIISRLCQPNILYNLYHTYNITHITQIFIQKVYRFCFSIWWNLSIVIEVGQMHQTTIVIGVEKAVPTLKSTPIHALDDSSDSKQCDQTQFIY